MRRSRCFYFDSFDSFGGFVIRFRLFVLFACVCVLVIAVVAESSDLVAGSRRETEIVCASSPFPKKRRSQQAANMNGLSQTLAWSRVCRLCLSALRARDVLAESSLDVRYDLDSRLHHAYHIFTSSAAAEEDVEERSGDWGALASHSSAPSPMGCPCQSVKSEAFEEGEDDPICECCDNGGGGVDCSRLKSSPPPASCSPTISNVPFHPTLLLGRRAKSCRTYRSPRPQARPLSPGGQDKLSSGEPLAQPTTQQEGRRQALQIAPEAIGDDSPHIAVQMLHCLSIEVSWPGRGELLSNMHTGRQTDRQTGQGLAALERTTKLTFRRYYRLSWVCATASSQRQRATYQHACLSLLSLLLSIQETIH